MKELELVLDGGYLQATIEDIMCHVRQCTLSMLSVERKNREPMHEHTVIWW